MEAIEELAEGIGPRPACSTKEEDAARWVTGQLEELGYGVAVEEFPSRPSYQRWYMVYLAPGIAGAFLLGVFPLASVVLGLAALVLYARDADGRPLLVPSSSRSRNVVAFPPGGSDHPRLVVMAHMDTARASVSFHPKLVSGVRASVVTLQVALAAIPALGAIAWIVEVSGAVPAALVVAGLVAGGYLAFAVFLMAHSELRMPVVAGANDNASGVEVLLRLAADTPPATWLVVTGSEEVGMLGAQAFFDRHHSAIGAARVLNLDSLGGGRVTAATEEGVLQARRADPEMVDEAAEAGAEVRAYRSLPTDATPLMARKIPALTLIALDERGVPPNWHWATDTADRIEEPALENATRIARAVVWSQVSGSAKT